MFLYILFVIIMPVMIYADYRIWKSRMQKTLAEQPDYDSNRDNYELLLEKLTAKQKNTSYIAGSVLTAAAIVLGMVYMA